MKKLGFLLLEGLLFLVALLPFWVLYGLADVIYVLVHYVARYRRRMVRANLSACFPDMSEKERRAIERRFYRNFADYIVESIKLLHVSDKTMRRHISIEGTENVSAILGEGRSVCCYFSHTFNWEWAPAITLYMPAAVADGVLFAQIYRPLRNKEFDALMLKVRSRFGSESISKRTTLRRMIELKRAGILSVTGYMSDQKPSHGDPIHIVRFLGRRTAVITGTETLARRMGQGVVFFDMHKERRGHYRLVIRPMAADASATEQYELTNHYFRLLEEAITRDPALWLWTHNRWKNTPPPQDNEQL
ncbi:MAG: acetyltransferase [Muribaculaceae bacterium]|nr:acetyltransferase [Muribaculaceae bacterium]